MALYSICRTPALHRGPSACESRVVGGAPAARGRVLVPAVPDPVRREVRCAEGGGDDTGMYHKRLPDQIVYADAETKGANGAPLLLVKDDEVYLTLGLIANYTDVQIQTFDSGDGRRVLINDWGTRNIARVKKAGSLRVKGGVKSKILTDLAEDDTVTVLDTMEKWSKVASSDGNIGYVENKRLAAAESQKFSGNFTAPVYKNTSMSGKIVLGWHQVTSQDGNNTFDSIVAKTKGMNVISPTWFSLIDNNGNYRSLANKDYVAKAHAKGLQVWALIDNFSAEKPDGV